MDFSRALAGLRGRLLLLVFVGALPILGVTLYQSNEMYARTGHEVRQDALRLARQIFADHQRVIGETRMLLSVLANVPVVRAENGTECGTFLRQMNTLDPHYGNFGVIGTDGLLRCSAQPYNAPVDFSARIFFQRTLSRNEFSVGEFRVGYFAATPVLSFGYPVRDEADTLVGVVYASLRLDWLNTLIAEAYLPAGSTLTLVDSLANILARYPQPQEWVGRNIAGTMQANGMHLVADEGTLESRGPDLVSRLYGYVRMRDIPSAQKVYLLVGIPAKVAYRAVDRQVSINMLAGLLAVVAMLALAWYLGGTLVGGAVERLCAATARYARGERATRVKIYGVRELVELGDAFNAMADSLQQQELALAQETQQVQRLNRVYRVLSGINGAILRIRERERLLHEACRIAVELGGFTLAWIAVRSEDTGGLRIVAHAGNSHTVLPQIEAALTHADADFPALTALLQGEYHVCNNLRQTDVRHAWCDDALTLGMPAVAIFPLRVAGRVAGLFGLHTADANFFDTDEIRLLEEMTADTSLGLEMIETEENLNYSAYYDRVSGLPNRLLFEDRLAQILSRAAREQRIVAVVAIDLVDLRKISDTLGRHVGDRMLREVGRHLEQALRDGDVVARVGGHSYAVLLSDVAREEDLPMVVARLMQDFPLTMHEDGQDIPVPVCAGIAAYPRDGLKQDELLHHAELALHAARSGVKIGHAFYSPEITANARDLFVLENELRHARERNDLYVHYQPVIDVASRRIVGAEALLRWSNPTLGLVSPDRFIPLAEEIGLIGEIGSWVFDEVNRQSLDWAGQELPGIRLTVNVSVRQLQQPDFSKHLLQKLESGTEVTARWPLAIEVTESAFAHDTEGMRDELRNLQRRGVLVYVDDFGTGYSSLRYLRELPVDVVKIDRSFIRDIAADAKAEALVNSVITLAHGLGLRVVAEGVETEAQFALLASRGCDMVQGYLFSKAVSAAELAALLQRGAME